MTLNQSQSLAMQKLRGLGNVFLTGAAGTGKSHVIREYMKDSQKETAVLATTGMAAIILNGRTFHSFFSLWDFNSPFHRMVGSALQNRKMQMRVQATDEIIIDEVSMLDERTMKAGEEIARKVRENDLPWGGMRVIAVGDFCQLPPVDPGRQRGQAVDWVFDTEVWHHSGFETVQLTEIMRTGDTMFMGILNKVRRGIVDDEVRAFMHARTITEDQAEHIEGTRMFSRRDEVAAYNQRRMDLIDAPVEEFPAHITTHTMFDPEKARAKLISNMPVDEVIKLKPGALVMIRKNNLDEGYANGSLGHYLNSSGGSLIIELLTGGSVVIEPMEFILKDGEGKIQAMARQFPVQLAWASTIHKVQGATMDVVVADISRLWDSGQAYVAMSRTKTAEGFHVINWSEGSVIADDRILDFYSA